MKRFAPKKLAAAPAAGVLHDHTLRLYDAVVLARSAAMQHAGFDPILRGRWDAQLRALMDVAEFFGDEPSERAFRGES